MKFPLSSPHSQLFFGRALPDSKLPISVSLLGDSATQRNGYLLPFFFFFFYLYFCTSINARIFKFSVVSVSVQRKKRTSLFGVLPGLFSLRAPALIIRSLALNPPPSSLLHSNPCNYCLTSKTPLSPSRRL